MTEDTPRRVSGCTLVALLPVTIPASLHALADVIWT